jgi:hypothetical protein
MAGRTPVVLYSSAYCRPVIRVACILWYRGLPENYYSTTCIVLVSKYLQLLHTVLHSVSLVCCRIMTIRARLNSVSAVVCVFNNERIAIHTVGIRAHILQLN